MDQNSKIRGFILLPFADFTVRDRDEPGLERSDRGQWSVFESLLYITKTEVPRCTLRLGTGSGQKEQHGTLPSLGQSLPAKVSLEPYVGSGWRRVCCRYWDDSIFCQLRVQIFGEVAIAAPRSGGGISWQAALQLQSWFTLHHPKILAMVWSYIPEYKPLAVIPK